MPKDASSQWGNPFVMQNQSFDERQRVTLLYRQWVLNQPELLQKIRTELHGKVLGCWCAPQQCHGNILAEIANTTIPFELISSDKGFGLIGNVPLENGGRVTAGKGSEAPGSMKGSVVPENGHEDDGKKKKKKKSQIETLLLASSSTAAYEQEGGGRSSSPPRRLKTLPSPDSHSTGPIRNSFAPGLTESDCPIIDIGINLTNPQLRSNWKLVLQRAHDVGVNPIILTSTSIENCEQNLQMCHEWNQRSRPDKGQAPQSERSNCQSLNQGPAETASSNTHSPDQGLPPLLSTLLSLYCTIGIHPHHANSYTPTVEKKLRSFIETHRHSSSSAVVAIGECGLDFHRNFSSREDQIYAFQSQLQLSLDYDLPLFLHDRDATPTLLQLLDQALTPPPPSSVASSHDGTREMPLVVIHCFTGSENDLREYLSRGYFIGVTGVVTHSHTPRGRRLRELLPLIPLERLMVETDAPFLSPWSLVEESGGGERKENGRGRGRGRGGGGGGRGRSCEPKDVLEVVRVVAEVLGREVREVKEVLYHNTLRFFRLQPRPPVE
jgi:TatD DNase family protein